MATLYGQNFRILTYDSVASKFKCVGMATNCTVNLNTNTEEASTKDDVGMAAKPEIVSKSWQVSVESLSIADAPAMLTAIKAMQPFTLLWDETSTTDNQTPLENAVSRQGSAYLNDLTLQLDDRANATKSLQFTGNGPLATVTSTPAFEEISAGSYTKGQYVRLFLGQDNTTTPVKVLAAPQSLSLHVSVSLETTTTKDTTGDWVVQEPTGISYDISTSGLVRSGDTITSTVAAIDLAALQSIYEGAAPVKWQIAHVSGANNRTKGQVLVSGSCILSSLSISAQNRQAAKFDASFNGWGNYTVEDTPSES